MFRIISFGGHYYKLRASIALSFNRKPQGPKSNVSGVVRDITCHIDSDTHSARCTTKKLKKLKSLNTTAVIAPPPIHAPRTPQPKLHFQWRWWIATLPPSLLPATPTLIKIRHCKTKRKKASNVVHFISFRGTIEELPNLLDDTTILQVATT